MSDQLKKSPFKDQIWTNPSTKPSNADETDGCGGYQKSDGKITTVTTVKVK